MLTAERLRELMNYDQETGRFTRLISVSSNARAGDIAGSFNCNGYRQIKIDGISYKEHRLAVLWMTGSWPKDQIDHADLNRAHNSWKNIREATRPQNGACTLRLCHSI
jgi:hypothetical protein